MTSSSRYKPFDLNIASEEFGDETVVVNLMTGAYYSLTGSAAAIWRRVINGFSKEEIHQDMLNLYGSQHLAQDLMKDLVEFISTLESEKLIVSDPSIETPSDTVLNMNAHEYRAPLLDKYQDMKDILLLDPVHDVNSLGWPQRHT